MQYKIGSVGDIVIPVTQDEILEEFKELMEYLKEKQIFTGKKGEIYSDIVYKGSNVIFLGMGEDGKIDSETVRLMYFKAGRELTDKKADRATVLLNKYPDLCYKKTAVAAYEGLYHSQYRFTKYRTTDKAVSSIEEIGFEVMAGKEDKISEALAEASALTEGITGRDLINEPAEYIYPETLAQAARQELEPLGVEVEVLGPKEIEELGMTAFLAVGRGSDREPRLIVMRWKNGGDEGVIGLVGKGLTYDSGGYAISAPGWRPCCDIGGAAAYRGNKPSPSRSAKNVTAVVAACENMISGRAYKNGDIIPPCPARPLRSSIRMPGRDLGRCHLLYGKAGKCRRGHRRRHFDRSRYRSAGVKLHGCSHQ